MVAKLNDFYEIIFLEHLQQMFILFETPLMYISKSKILAKFVVRLFSMSLEK